MKLGAYHYSIGYKPYRNHENADELSRLHFSEEVGHVPMPADVLLVLNQIESTTVKSNQIKSEDMDGMRSYVVQSEKILHDSMAFRELG